MRRTIILSISLSLALLCLIGMPSPVLAQGYGGGYAGRYSFTFSPGVLFGDAIYEGRILGLIDVDVDIEDGFIYLFRGEYAFTDNIALEVNIGGSTNDAEGTTENFVAGLIGQPSSSSNASMEWDGDQFLLAANAIYQYPMNSVVPFVTVGIGLVKWSLDLQTVNAQVGGSTLTLEDIEATGRARSEFEIDETDLDLSFGAGVKFHVTDNTVVRIDVRDHVVFPEDDEFFGDAETLHMIELSAGVSYVW